MYRLACCALLALGLISSPKAASPDVSPTVDSVASQSGGTRTGPFIVAAGPDADDAEKAPPHPCYPQGGTLGRDLFVGSFVNGGRGWDSFIRSFREQAIGVPVFAVLGGVVRETHDGEFDAHTKDTLAGIPDPQSNYVVIDHGNGQLTRYLHLKLGSIAVAAGESVAAGTQIGLTGSSGRSDWPHLHFESLVDGASYEPTAEPCRAGTSDSMNHPALEASAFDIAFSPQPFDSRLLPHDDATRTGTYALGSQQLYFRIGLSHLPPGSVDRIRVKRPDGSLAVDERGAFEHDQWLGASYWDWAWRLALDVPGTWHLLYEVNGAQLVEAPFDVATTTHAVNRAPHAVSITLESPGEVLIARVQTPLLVRDPDYDIVQYRYQWRVGGIVVRDVTSAALSDVIPLPGDGAVTVTVTPSDGRMSGPATTAGQQVTSATAEAMPDARLATSESRALAAPQTILPGSCGLGPISVTPAGLFTGSASITGTFRVSAPLGCTWFVPQSFIGWAHVTWVDLVSRTVTYSIAANNTGAVRRTRIDVLVAGGGGDGGGGPWIPSGTGFDIEQDYRGGGDGTYTVAPEQRNHGATGGSGEFTVTTTPQTSTWTAALVAGSPPGLTITKGSSGTGNGVVQYTLDANPSTRERTYQLLIAGKTVKVVQAGSPTWSAFGEVRNASSGTALAGVKLVFTDVAGGQAPAAKTTNAQGKWEQSGFTAGRRYRVTASLDGYVIRDNDKVMDENSNWASFLAVRLFCVDGVVWGVASTAPPPDVVIELLRAPSLNPFAQVKVDNQGNFSHCNLEEGTQYTARPFKAGWLFDPGTSRFTTDASSLHFTAYRIFQPKGVVRDRLATAIPGVIMKFQVLSGGGAVPPPVSSDASGWIGQSNLFDTRKRFRVTPSLAGYMFTPEFAEFGDDARSLDFVASREKFSVSGRITDSSNNNSAVPDVTITFERTSGTGYVPSSASTDANGAWSKQLFERGTTYLATPTKPGWRFDPIMLGFDRAQTALDFYGYQPFTVTGVVRNRRQQPLAGVTLTFETLGAGRPGPPSVVTGADGTYSQSGFDPREKYRVTATLANHQFEPAFGRVDVVSPRCEFIGSADYQVSGRIGNGSGTGFAPLAGVTVRFARRPGPGPVPDSVRTDAQGRWTAAGFAWNTQYAAIPDLAGHVFTPVDRAFQGPIDQLDFTFTGPFSVAGRVIDNATRRGIADVVITITDAAGATVGQATSDREGDWQVDGLARAGTYTATPARNLFVFEPPTRRFSPPAARQAIVGNENFQAKAPYPVTVTVRREDQTGLGGVTLTFTDAAGNQVLRDATNQNGTLTTGSVFTQGVRYAVRASDEFSMFKPSVIEFNGPRDRLTFTESPPYTVSGTIRQGGERNVRLLGVTVTFTPVEGGAAKTAASDKEGFYKCEGLAPDTSYDVTAALDGWTFNRVARVHTFATRNIIGQPAK